MPGKVRDYQPAIRAAGLHIEQNGTVHGCFQIYNGDDAIETVMHEGGLKKVDVEYKRQKMSNWRHREYYEECRSALVPPMPTRYQTLLNDLKETVSGSYWTMDVGRCRDPVGAFPAGMDVANTVFGIKSVSDTPMKDIVNPPKSRYEIQWETNEYHPMYRKTHNDYYPGEQITHNYLVPPYDPKKKYGKYYNYDKRGPCLKICLRDCNGETVMSANKIQADIKEKTQYQVGKCLTPNNNIKCVPPDARFGIKSERPLCGVEELMKPNEEPNVRKKDFYMWLNHLNELRLYHKKSDVDFNEIKQLCLYYDKEHTGWIAMDIFHQILIRLRVTFDHSLILPLAAVFGYVNEDRVKYREFLDMFRADCELPEIPKLDGNFDADCHYLTTNQKASMDYLECDNSKLVAAGIPSMTCDSKKVLDTLESSARIAVSPSIYTNYSLSHIDFWEPRSPQYIRKLFEAVGYEFPEDRFEELWKIATQFDKSDEVCVDTFKYVLQEVTPKKEPLDLKEVDCDVTKEKK